MEAPPRACRPLDFIARSLNSRARLSLVFPLFLLSVRAMQCIPYSGTRAMAEQRAGSARMLRAREGAGGGGAIERGARGD